jgi:hypothetical protein
MRKPIHRSRRRQGDEDVTHTRPAAAVSLDAAQARDDRDARLEPAALGTGGRGRRRRWTWRLPWQRFCLLLLLLLLLLQLAPLRRSHP